MGIPKRKTDHSHNTFYISGDSVNPVREAALIAGNIQTALRNKELAEVLFHEIPTADNDVFSRRITIVKQPRHTPGFEQGDDPDLDDVYVTDLPWMGKVSFKNASRQFRSRFQIGVAVDVVREIDGYLYHLSEKSLGFRSHGIEDGYCIIDVERHPIDPRTHKVTINPIRDAADIMMHFGIVPPIPASLVGQLSDLGYVLEDGDFVHRGPDYESRITCRLYGKLNRK